VKTIKVGRKKIGPDEPVFVIAEAGANHNRSLKTARRLIDVAVRAGADAVKFQTYSGAGMYSKYTPEIGYIRKRRLARRGETIRDLIDRISLPRDWQKRLAAYCRRRKIIFLSTPFDLEAVDQLDRLGVPAFKIASFEINHIPLIRHAAGKKKPLLLSTGMADLADIETALGAAASCGNRKVALLHCAINYPPRYQDVNLRAMETMRLAFDLPVGFSDHTPGSTVAVAAAALGARIIEKHFTLSRKLPGPDHPFALEPDELAAMVRAVRETEQALGSSIKRRTPAEEELYRKARRGLVAACEIPAGRRITRKMLAVKRPGYGISPVEIARVVGRRARRDLREDEILTWEMLD
jgi:sialic acid synthase SpsE